ncbi:hypothetical protein [Kribbella solani]|uniref:tRNA(Ile2) C34 agmatinyltransferase TiaS n=1 Tax=Kribbella solani TaxID=236067 RepID=A0A841DXG8_9ACTN|nr:hypothetical protein [Kribbella solani]MBB5981505.1 tRNA(Ile2) C34 agmatinyltransferase TiaS [Kribbella solani]
MSDPVHAVLLGGSSVVLAGLASAANAADTLSRPEQIAVLVIAALVLTGIYLLACTVWPYANCPRCEGSGKSRSPGGKKFRNCPRCEGTGRRERLGRRLLRKGDR